MARNRHIAIDFSEVSDREATDCTPGCKRLRVEYNFSLYCKLNREEVQRHAELLGNYIFNTKFIDWMMDGINAGSFDHIWYDSIAAANDAERGTQGVRSGGKRTRNNEEDGSIAAAAATIGETGEGVRDTDGDDEGSDTERAVDRLEKRMKRKNTYLDSSEDEVEKEEEEQQPAHLGASSVSEKGEETIASFAVPYPPPVAMEQEVGTTGSSAVSTARAMTVVPMMRASLTTSDEEENSEARETQCSRQSADSSRRSSMESVRSEQQPQGYDGYSFFGSYIEISNKYKTDGLHKFDVTAKPSSGQCTVGGIKGFLLGYIIGKLNQSSLKGGCNYRYVIAVYKGNCDDERMVRGDARKEFKVSPKWRHVSPYFEVKAFVRIVSPNSWIAQLCGDCQEKSVESIRLAAIRLMMRNIIEESRMD